MKKGRRRKHSHSSKEDPSKKSSRKYKKTVVEEKFLSESAEERGEYGPRASSPVQCRLCERVKLRWLYICTILVSSEEGIQICMYTCPNTRIPSFILLYVQIYL